MYVDDDAAPGGLGSSWNDAFDSLGTAMGLIPNSTVPVQEVWVAAGTYTPTSSTFELTDGVAVYGGFAGNETELDQRDWLANETILSGDLNGDDGPDFQNYVDNSDNVVTGVDNSVLDGFIIEAGNADGALCGGGMRNDNASPTVINCIFRNNLGTAMCNNGGSPTVINCAFLNNSGGFGGGISNENSNATLINCALLGNASDATGAGINIVGGSPTLINCTIADSTAAFNGGGLFSFNSTPTVVNSIVWGNLPNNIVVASGTTTVSHSNVEGGWGGAGANNIDADPLFVDSGNGVYRLSSGSPSIDAADNTAVPVGITTDLDGNARFVDDPNTPDCQQAPGQCGNPPVADMGAYELGGVPCPWDCDDFDGTVGIVDFLGLLGQWDSAGSCDLDGGGVGITDLLKLLANWGPCP